MVEAVQDKVSRSLQAAESLYHRLVLLVGATGSGKTGVLSDVAAGLGAEVINVNLELSADLLDLTAKQRALRLPGVLDQIVDKLPSTVVLDNLEILFEMSLKQDPLRLLQGISRNRSVVASWNGTTAGGWLTCAESGHPEYRRYDLAGLTVVGMDGTATIDSNTKINEAGQA